MPTSGIGYGIPVPVVPPAPGNPSNIQLLPEFQSLMAVSLPRYVAITAINECAFWGVNAPGIPDYQCRKLWLKSQRDELFIALMSAQELFEREIGYPLRPRWIQEEQRYNPSLLTNQGHVINFGVYGSEILYSDFVVDYTDDPCRIGPFYLDGVPIDSIHLFYHGYEIEISPSKTEYYDATDEAVFYVPRCRMVKIDSWENPPEGWDYDDVPPSETSVFEPTVDIGRVYTEPYPQATIKCQGDCRDEPCADTDQDACVYIKDSENGYISISAASYSAGAWSNLTLTNCRPVKLLLYYTAGLVTFPFFAEQAVVRLAHTLMPSEVCECDEVIRLWQRDVKEPRAMTPDRANCPFGLSDGAWFAWQQAKAMKLYRGSSFSGVGVMQPQSWR